MPLELLFPALLTAGVIWIWLRDWRLYRHDFGRALRASFIAARRSRVLWFLFAATLMLLLGAVSAPHFLAELPAEGSVFVLWSLTGVVAMTLTWGIHPPGLLLLGSSAGPDPRSLSLQLRLAVQGHGVRYFLRPQDASGSGVPVTDALDRFYGGMTENRYALTDEDWQAIVFPLIDLVPVIAIDARAMSKALAEEITRIGANPHLSVKSILLIHPWQSPEMAFRAPLVMQTYSEPQVQQAAAMKLHEYRAGRARPSAAYDQYSVRLEQQMMRIALTGPPFLKAIQGAGAYGGESAFLREAAQLGEELAGKPGDGALEVYHDLQSNIQSVHRFLERWQTGQDQHGLSVLAAAREMYNQLVRMQETVAQTPPEVMAEILRRLRAG